MACLTEPSFAYDDGRSDPESARGSDERATDEIAMFGMLNRERRSRGLGMLAFDEDLRSIARQHAEDMALRNYFSHTSPDGLSPFARMDRAHYRYSYAGENLALDQSVTAASNALWTSSEHRSNILQPHFGRVGIAAVAVADGEIFVEDFSD